MTKLDPMCDPLVVSLRPQSVWSHHFQAGKV